MLGNEFAEEFGRLTRHEPYPWQTRLYVDWFVKGQVPSAVELPTGSGKTGIMAIWLLALAGGARLPRRLVWVVDRRAVVDQATSVAEQLRDALDSPPLGRIRDALRELSAAAGEGESPLAISTLRGAFEDNGEWKQDPARPAIIVGTVDMVGSRLLFSGYRAGRYHRPFHAGPLGRDAPIVLDEAHLSRPFAALLKQVESLQARGTGSLPPFRCLPLSATLGSPGSFSLLPSERQDGQLARVLGAPKRLVWHVDAGMPLGPEEFREGILACARSHGDRTARVVIYLDRLRDAAAVLASLSKDFPGRTVPLTGTMRGFERDRLVKSPVFSRFLKRRDGGEGAVFLVSTAAGEVGIDLYAEQMICELVPVDRMVQRFGRVNRAGDGEATVDIVPPEPHDPPAVGLNPLRVGSADGDPPRGHDPEAPREARAKEGRFPRFRTRPPPAGGGSLGRAICRSTRLRAR